MRKPSVFVSSTCYDLKQLRSDLRLYLENAGLDPVLSEYATFPVDPDAPTVANCRRAVERNADVFVMVIGGRYGSMTDQGKSVTNLEYVTAKAKGIPVYVFVMRSLLSILPVWRENPGGNYASVADSPKLFDFISSIQSGGDQWVFPFDDAQEIVSVLRAQLAYLFGDALELRKRASQYGVRSGKYAHLSGRELRLVIDRPEAWEYLLFSEALSRELEANADLKRDWLYNVAFGASVPGTPKNLFAYFQQKNTEASRLFTLFNTLFDQALTSGFGAPGQPGDPDAILYVASRAGAIYKAALEWKLDFLRVAVNEALAPLRSAAACLCDNAVKEVEEFASDLSTRLADALAEPKGVRREMTIKLVLTVPDLAAFHDELERLTALIQSGELAWD